MSSSSMIHHSEDVASDATWQGYVHGIMTAIPTAGAVFLAMRHSPQFVARTNAQSRTALIVMPALYAFSYYSEHTITDRIKVISAERSRDYAYGSDSAVGMDAHTGDLHLTDLYQKSFDTSDYNVVPGNQLCWYHKAANYTASNPIRVLAGVAVPTVAGILYGRGQQRHLDFSVKLLHTRVFGQFATLSLLLSIMGFREFMDHNGRFITQAEVDARNDEIKHARQALLRRLEQEQEHQKALRQEVVAAHKEDEKERVGSKHLSL